MDIYLTETKLYSRTYHYIVWVDGERYSEFFWNDYPLTWSQQNDVADGYREGLTDW